VQLSNDLEFRGLIYQTSDPELSPLLDAGEITGYIGFDPSADSLHAGNLLQLCLLRSWRAIARSSSPAAAPGGSATRAARTSSARS